MLTDSPCLWAFYLYGKFIEYWNFGDNDNNNCDSLFMIIWRFPSAQKIHISENTKSILEVIGGYETEFRGYLYVKVSRVKQASYLLLLLLLLPVRQSVNIFLLFFLLFGVYFFAYLLSMDALDLWRRSMAGIKYRDRSYRNRSIDPANDMEYAFSI